MIGPLKGRSLPEAVFRLRQEAFNLATRLRPPGPVGEAAPGRLMGLPPVERQLDAVRGTPQEAAIVRLADEILARRVPLLGHGPVDPGDPPGWRRDWIHGKTSPLVYQRKLAYLDFESVGDHKVVWELSRHQHFVVLAQAYRLSGRAGFLDGLRRQWLHWIEANPFQCGIHWTSALEAAFRALSWMWALHLCGDMLPAGPILTSLRQHALYLERNLSRYFSPNTHLLGEAVALHALGQALGGVSGAGRWRTSGDGIVREQLARQVRSDGSHFEQSTYYHLYALDFFLLHYLLSGRPDAMRPALERMARYLEAVMGPAGRLPFVGDDDGGRVFHPYGDRETFGRATLATCRRLFGTPGGMADPGVIAEQAAWWLGEPAAGGAAPAARPAPVQVFPDAGAVVLSHGPWWVLFKTGSFGPGNAGHSHSDSLSLVVRVRDEDLLVDPGTFTYTTDAVLRRAFRGSSGHNTIRVDGCDQAVEKGPFAWSGRPATEMESAQPAHAAAVCRYPVPGGEVTHRRAVQVEAARILIHDEVEGPPGQHLCELYWHAGAGVRELTPEAFLIGGAAVLRVEGTAAVEDGWRSRAYGSREPAPVIVSRRRGAFPMRFTSTLEVSS